MKSKKIVHVIGTGTIGEPLIGLLARNKKNFEIDEITFHKNNALSEDISKVYQLIDSGAILSADEKKFNAFKEFGVTPQFKRREAIKRASVVVDCTPKGVALQHKRDYYLDAEKSTNLFIAQGSEKNFGKPYAYGINEQAFSKEKYAQIVSCNTHNMAVLMDFFMQTFGTVVGSKFLCIRRSNDISQDGGITPAIEVGKHDDPECGTHHARDVQDLFKTLRISVPVYSSVCKINSQYMHAIHFSFTVQAANKDDALSAVLSGLKEYPNIAITNKKTSNKVFSFGRDYGLYGRILSQSVVSLPSISARKLSKDFCEVNGFAFTPQDANSLLSSMSMILWGCHNKDWEKAEKLISALKPYLYKVV